MDIVIPAVAGLLSGAVASLIAPWIHWGIEKRRQQLAYRRELISGWRKMIQRVTRTQTSETMSLAYLLERYDEFYSLRPHLSQTVIVEIYSGRTHVAGATIPAGLVYALEDIGRIEKEWGLV